MSDGATRDSLADRLSILRNGQDASQLRREITTIVETVIAVLQGDLSADDVHLYHELETLADFIHQARSEIAQIRPQDIGDEHIPTATDELDAIVNATEEATGTILDSAERIEAAVDAMPAEVGERVSSAVTAIYEACNFQDITGQRIGKVVRTLKVIEQKVDALVAAFGEGGRPHDAGVRQQDLDPNSAEYEAANLLEGPQLGNQGNSQDDVDALFGTAT